MTEALPESKTHESLAPTFYEGKTLPMPNHSSTVRSSIILQGSGRVETVAVAVLMVAAVWTAQVSAQACPSLERSWNRGPSWAVAAKDGIAFVGSGGGVIVVEFGLDEDPRIIAELALAESIVTALDVSASILVAVAGDLWVFDVDDPSSPVELARFSLPNGANDVVVDDGYVFIAGGDAALRILDIHDPSMPVQVSEYNRTGNARGVRVSGSIAYLWDKRGADLEVIDVTNVADPVSLSTIRDIGISDLDLFGGEAVILSRGRLQVLNIDDPTAPRMVGSLDLPGNLFAVNVTGEIAYVAADHAGLRIVDLHDPTKPVEIGHQEASRNARRVDIASGFALVANAYRGLWIVDVHAPSSPRDVGFVSTRIGARAAAAAGDYAYVVGPELRVVNVSSPSGPVEVGMSPDSLTATDLALIDGLAIVADETTGVLIFDVSTPTRPVEIGRVDTPGDAVGIEVVAPFVYVADRRSGLRVIDISEPTEPVEIGHCESPIDARTVASLGQYVLVGDAGASDIGGSGIRVVDVSHPQSPVEKAFLPTDAAVSTISIADGFALVGLIGGHRGPLVVDVHDPLTPEVVGSIDALSRAWIVSIAVDGGFAYVTYRTSSIWGTTVYWFTAFNIMNPDEPTQMGTEYLGVDGGGTVAVAGRYVLIPRGGLGLDLFASCSPPAPRRAGGRAGT